MPCGNEGGEGWFAMGVFVMVEECLWWGGMASMVKKGAFVVRRGCLWLKGVL